MSCYRSELDQYRNSVTVTSRYRKQRLIKKFIMDHDGMRAGAIVCVCVRARARVCVFVCHRAPACEPLCVRVLYVCRSRYDTVSLRCYR